MRTVNATFEAAINDPNVKVCELYTLTLQTGTIYRYTSHSEDITWDAANNIYTSIPIIRGEIVYTSNFESDEVEIMLAKEAVAFKDGVINNILDGVGVSIKRILWNDTYAADKEIIVFIGTADVLLNRSTVQLTCRPDYDRMNVKLPKHIFQEPCCHALFDVGCALTQSNYLTQGVASGGSSTTLEDTNFTGIHKIEFDNGDINNPIVIGDTLMVGGSNDFSDDDDCQGWWKMNDGVLEIDTKNANDMTDVGGVVSDTDDYKTGDASADFTAAGSDRFYRNDSQLSADFPLKTGDTNKEISTAFWVKLKTAPAVSGYMSLVCKYLSGVFSDRVFATVVQNQAGITRFGFFLGYNGGASADSYFNLDVEIVLDQWYHVVVTYKDSDQSIKMRIWDDAASTTSDALTPASPAANPINVEHAPLEFGSMTNGALYLNGKLDEVVIFKDVLTLDEIDLIRLGAYRTTPSGDAITVLNVEYLTNTTGVIYYEQVGTTPVLDDYTLIAVGSSNIVIVNGDSATDEYFYYQGELKITSGVNNGQRRAVLSLEDTVITVMWPFPVAIQAGDTYNLYTGCDKTPDTCKDKYNNVANFKGFPYIPKIEETIM